MKKRLLLVPFVIVLLVGCNNFPVKDAVEAAALQSPAAVPLALQKMILEYNFRVQTEGLSDEQIQQQYDKFMQLLPKADRNALVEMVEQILAQTPSNSASVNNSLGTDWAVLFSNIWINLDAER